MADDIWKGLAIALPTFRRNEQLLNVLTSVGTQTVLPEIVVVIDNSPDGAAQPVVDGFRDQALFHLQYLRMGRNTGPAGAFAAALETLGGHPLKPEWMLCRGDDNPFGDVGTIEALLWLSRSEQGRVSAGVGIYGKQYHSTEHPHAGGSVVVDYIPGGGVPAYNIQALQARDLNFNEGLFFGFEELDLGLRIKRAGLQLLAERVAERNFVIAPKRSPPWRTYFGERNLIMITREFKSPATAALYAARAVRSSIRRLVFDRSAADALACLLGGIDGLLGAPARNKYIPR